MRHYIRISEISRKVLLAIGLSFTIAMGFSCNKEEFLSAKPSSGLIVPTRLDELQALMDQEFIVYQTPLFGIISSDEYYLKDANWQAQRSIVRNAYIWDRDIYEGESYAVMNDWDFPYKQVFIANIVLDELHKLTPSTVEREQWDDLKGKALFLRSKALFAMAEVFCMPYNESTAKNDLGLPIRVTPDVEATVKRSSVEETYHRIVDDLITAKDLLGDPGILSNKLRPTKITAFALLARVSLAQRKYEDAGRYADSVLTRYDHLIDFNTVGTGWFSLNNEELIYHNIAASGNFVVTPYSGVMHVDSVLYGMYADNDLRKSVFYEVVNDRVYTKQNFSALSFCFTGLAVDEMYLIRSEVYARDDDPAMAAQLLNRLLEQRHKTGTYVPLSFSDGDEALQMVLSERRKELPFSGARWSDVRRLNLEGANITMRRVIGGQTYTLPPNDPRFALNLPRYELDISGIPDNSR